MFIFYCVMGGLMATATYLGLRDQVKEGIYPGLIVFGALIAGMLWPLFLFASLSFKMHRYFSKHA